MRLILLFIVVPFVELFLLLKLAEWTSGGFTFALVIDHGHRRCLARSTARLGCDSRVCRTN